MKKILMLFFCLIILTGISVVSATDNESISLNDGEILASSFDNESLSLELNSNTNVSLNLNETAKVVSQSNSLPSKVSTKNIKSTYGDEAKYSLKVLDKSGNPVSGIQVTFKINKKVFKVKTGSDGVASLNLNYNAGEYTIHYSVGSLSGKNTYIVKNKVTLTILKWGNKGDVSKIKLLKKNMPNNIWVKKAVEATKKGNPLLKFQGSKGKTVFITAGVHGNELSSQVAVMKLISHLSKKPIKGTVYIIPFVNIKAISNKVRHTGVDYNRVAHKSGTISNKIVKLIVKYDCDAYGDFHTTQPGGIPGKNIVMGSKSPVLKSALLTKYISKHSKVNKRIYKYAGQQYPGALADNVNKHKIPAVICEVMLPHNTVTSKTVKTSYSMMKNLLKFNSII